MEIRKYKPSRARQLEILSIEDNPAERTLIAEVLKARAGYVNVSFVSDGDEAMQYLRQDGAFGFVPRPDLILLDLNLPKRDGYELLAEIRALPELVGVPVLVFSTSRDERDKLRCRRLRASGYLTKPTQLDEYDILLKAIDCLGERSLGNEWLDLDEMALPTSLRLEREARRLERDEMRKRIATLERRVAHRDRTIEGLEDKIWHPFSPPDSTPPSDDNDDPTFQ